MIENLLCHSYPVERGVAPNGYIVEIIIHSGISSFSDSKACDRCVVIRPERNECNKEQLIIDFGKKSISVVKFEDYAKQFDDTPAAFGEKCDLLFVDDTEAHSKVAFCDLTCSDEEWVNTNGGFNPEGKRAKATRQMMLSLESLLASSLISEYILTSKEKVCIFGWRDYTCPNQPVKAERKDVVRNSLAFGTTPSSMANQLSTEQMVLSHNFKFIQVKYPSIYRW